eukprot:GHVP01047598.1.p1 GENE.GHVP01047598.1~~GHVP01047598.1.p1  ORF type:complete len:430 (+),score=52.29 GHVP01047598.1:28-1290(+)
MKSNRANTSVVHAIGTAVVNCNRTQMCDGSEGIMGLNDSFGLNSSYDSYGSYGYGSYSSYPSYSSSRSGRSSNRGTSRFYKPLKIMSSRASSNSRPGNFASGFASGRTSLKMKPFKQTYVKFYAGPMQQTINSVLPGFSGLAGLFGGSKPRRNMPSFLKGFSFKSSGSSFGSSGFGSSGFGSSGFGSSGFGSSGFGSSGFGSSSFGSFSSGSSSFGFSKAGLGQPSPFQFVQAAVNQGNTARACTPCYTPCCAPLVFYQAPVAQTVCPAPAAQIVCPAPVAAEFEQPVMMCAPAPAQACEPAPTCVQPMYAQPMCAQPMCAPSPCGPCAPMMPCEEASADEGGMFFVLKKKTIRRTPSGSMGSSSAKIPFSFSRSYRGGSRSSLRSRSRQSKYSGSSYGSYGSYGSYDSSYGSYDSYGSY